MWLVQISALISNVCIGLFNPEFISSYSTCLKTLFNLFCLLKALHPLPLKSQCCCKETKTKLPLSVHNHVKQEGLNIFGWSTCEVWQTKLPRYTHHVQVQARWVTLDDLLLLRVFPIGKNVPGQHWVLVKVNFVWL